jgi:uncharacterized protein (DUF983 family)
MSQHTDLDALSPKTLWQAIKRGLKGKCPNCGESHLWRSYIKPVEVCAHCDFELGKIRADDGPSWLTILIVGHVWSPFIVMIALYDISKWILFPAVMLAALGSCLAVLPLAKGLFMGVLVKTNAGEDTDYPINSDDPHPSNL